MTVAIQVGANALCGVPADKDWGTEKVPSPLPKQMDDPPALVTKSMFPSSLKSPTLM